MTHDPTQSEEIRALTLDHLDECASLWVSICNSEPFNEHWTLETARKRLSETLNTPGFVGFVFFDNEPLGYAVGYCEQWDAERIFYLKDIVVKTDMQRRGIGTKLIRHLEKVLKEMNVNHLYLLAEPTAEGFYAKNGYQAGGMRFMRRRL